MAILFPYHRITKTKKSRNCFSYYSGLLQLYYKYPDRSKFGQFKVNIPFLCDYFNRSKAVIWYHLNKLQQQKLIKINIKHKQVFIDLKIKEDKMGNHYQKVQMIKQQCQELFDFWCRVLKTFNLVVPKTCNPEMFGMFKQLAKEYDLEVIKNGICYFYACYSEIIKQYKLSATIPRFIDFYRRRVDIINTVNQYKFDFRSVLKEQVG